MGIEGAPEPIYEPEERPDKVIEEEPSSGFEVQEEDPSAERIGFENRVIIAYATACNWIAKEGEESEDLKKWFLDERNMEALGKIIDSDDGRRFLEELVEDPDGQKEAFETRFAEEINRITH